MELNKFLWCNECGEITMLSENNKCPSCDNEMIDIGFVEGNTKKSVGGSVKPGLCSCGEPRASKGLDEYGRRRYRTQCYQCVYKARLVAKAERCNICGIKPDNESELHKDHIDGNRSNNSTTNIQTLCVECHKYKTNKQQDWKKKNEN